MKKITSLFLLLLLTLSAIGQSVTGPQRLLYATKSEVRTYGLNLARAYQVYNFTTRQDEFFVYDSGDSTSPESDSVIVSGSNRFKRMTRIPGGSSGSLAWNDITGKPSTFTPSTHSQAISTVTGLLDSLNTRQKTLTLGSTLQYRRGDNSLATHDKASVGLPFVQNVDQTIATNLTSGSIPTGRYATRTIPPSSITQASATTGQALVWDGTNWGPATVSGSGGSTPTVSARSLFGNDSTGAKTGVSLSVLQTKAMLNIPVTPKDFGAIGNGTTNDSTAFAQWAAAAASVPGRYVISAGTYKINGTVTFAFNGTAAFQTIIEASGAKIVTDNAATKPVIRINNTKRMTLHGLTVVGTVDTDGMWQSTLLDNEFDIVRIGVSNLDTFDEGYYNNWTGGEINELHIYTGASGDLTEFNSNVFNSVKFQGGSYAFKVYGTGLAQGIVFNACDISYQSTSILYVDAAKAGDVSMIFNYCYMDSDNGFPNDLKGVKAVFNHCITPNSANVNAFFTDSHSLTPSTSFSGVRNGGRSASSGVNLITNGDFRDGISGFSTTWTASMVSGAGMYSQYLHATASSTQKEIIFTSIPVPYDGYYTLSMVGRNVAGSTVVSSNFLGGIDSLYSPVTLVASSTRFAQSEGTFYLKEGTVYRFKIYSQASVSNEIDIAYVALTYGAIAPEISIAHPTARATPTAKNNTNLFQRGDGGSIGAAIAASADGLSAVVDTTGDKTGEGYVLRFNPLTATDFPTVTFTLPSAYLKAARVEGKVTLSLWAKITSGYGNFATNVGFADTYVTPGTTTTGTWHRWVIRVDVPTGATRVQFKVTMAAAATAKDIAFDAVQMNIGNESVPWAISPLDISATTGSITGLVTVSNVSALRALSGTSGQMVRTLGYYTANDQGGAYYIWNSSLSSGSNPDNGVNYIYPSGGSGGGWEFVYDGTINSKQGGAKGDYITDDTQQLQRLIDFVVNKSGRLNILRGIFRITSGLNIGTASPVSNPFTEVSFTISGTGPTLNNTATDQIYTNGTLILLTGTGHSAIMNVRAGASRFAKFEDFTISCATLGGSTNGFLWSQTVFSQHKLTRVHSWNANRAFAVVNGTGTNGEFTEFNFCQGYGLTRFYYMDSASGQAFNQRFNDCGGQVDDGGILFEIGGSSLGYGFTAHEFATSNTWNVSTGTGVTLLKNNGISGNINFIGGRMEALSTLINHSLGTYNMNGRINFYGVHFDGMASKAARPFITSSNSGSAAAYTYDFQNCTFSATSSDATLDIVLGSSDASQYYFERCSFAGFKSKTITTNSDERTAVVFTRCKEYDLTGALVDFSKEIKYRDTDALSSRTVAGENAEQAVGIAENLLQYSNFGVNSGAALSPWVHYGTGTTFYEVRKIGYGGVNFVSPHSIQAIFRATSGVSQVVAAAPFNTTSQTYYYQAYVSTEYALARPITFTLENSVTGTVYESVTIANGNKITVPVLITLKATDGNVGGYLKLKIYNGGADLGIVNINWQLVSKYANAAFVPTGSTAITGYTIWSQSSDMVRVTGRLKIPLKDDETGSAASTITDLSNDASADIYNSTTTGRLKNYSDGKWREIPNSTFASAKPTTGTWKLSDIVYNSAPNDTALFWVNTTAGTPGTWATVGKYAAGGGGSGTVTSVAMSVPSFLSISGSPVTSSGTLAVSLSGTALPVANGGTGGTSASAARTALGLAIGTDVAAISSPTFTGTPAAPTATAGTNTTQVATTAFVTNAVAKVQESLVIAASDETTALTTGTGKVTFRMPYAMTVTSVRISLSVAQSSGSIMTVDINESGTTILSTKLTVDNTEKTSNTAATAAVVSDTSLADDAEITIDIDQVGDGTAKGLKIIINGTRS